MELKCPHCDGNVFERDMDTRITMQSYLLNEKRILHTKDEHVYNAWTSCSGCGFTNFDAILAPKILELFI